MAPSPERTDPGDPADGLVDLIGSGQMVPCLDGTQRVAIELDQAASTQAHPEVAARVEAFLPWYSSVHRGAGYRSRHATASYEEARRAVLAFAGRDPNGPDVAIFGRNTTEAINQVAFRLQLDPTDVVVTTVVEHHANLLPWGRVARRRYVECTRQGTFTVADVCAALDQDPAPALLAVTAASNVTGWLPPLEAIIDQAHDRGVRVVVDGAQLAPHRPLPSSADFVAFSGHKIYAPFGTGALIGPRAQFESGEPFLAGGGAVDLVGLDEVIWTEPPDREEAGSPNVVGAVALHAAVDALGALGWGTIVAHERVLAERLVRGLSAIDGVRLLGPAGGTDWSPDDTLPVAAFTIEGIHHALVASRLSAEYGIAVRHGCFCAHPYVVRLLGVADKDVDAYRSDVLRGDHRTMPGAVRASAGLGTSGRDIDALLAALAELADGRPPPVPYRQDRGTGDFFPVTDQAEWRDAPFEPGAACSRG